MDHLLDALTSNPTLDAVLLAVASAGIGLWLVAAWWAYVDMSRRARPERVRLVAPAWILISTPVLLPLALASYLLVRPQHTMAERRSRDILEALVPASVALPTCSGCGDEVDADWRRCPACATWLGAPCSACGRWSSPDLEICPFCATDRVDDLAVGQRPARVEAGPEAAAVVRDRVEQPAPVPWNRRARADRLARVPAAASGSVLARLGR